jgi:hypothetical protein
MNGGADQSSTSEKVREERRQREERREEKREAKRSEEKRRGKMRETLSNVNEASQREASCTNHQLVLHLV